MIVMPMITSFFASLLFAGFLDTLVLLLKALSLFSPQKPDGLTDLQRMQRVWRRVSCITTLLCLCGSGIMAGGLFGFIPGFVSAIAGALGAILAAVAISSYLDILRD
jgi:hypothetical protein